MSKTVDRSLLQEGDICAFCKFDLRKAKEIHAVMGMHFCSELCAVSYKKYNSNTTEEEAEQWYRDLAEVVTPIDIGLVKG